MLNDEVARPTSRYAGRRWFPPLAMHYGEIIDESLRHLRFLLVGGPTVSICVREIRSLPGTKPAFALARRHHSRRAG